MANPGDLDTSFDGNGKKAINFGGTDAARVVLVQPNGRIVVAGGGAAAGSRFACAGGRGCRRVPLSNGEGAVWAAVLRSP